MKRAYWGEIMHRPVLPFLQPKKSVNRYLLSVSLIKLKLIISYHGAAYQGWQAQKTGLGIQSVVEEALHRFCPQASRLCGCSRTDTGVHALGMVAHVEIPRQGLSMPPEKLRLAMNAHLPHDVRVVRATRVPLGFHARYDARRKQYRYRIWNHPAMNPLLNGLAWHVPVRLNRPAMQEAAAQFVGTHDFRSVASNRDYGYESTVRTLFRCEVRCQAENVIILLEGSGFLYKMCRGIAGTLIAVGKGKWEPSMIPTILQSKNRSQSGMNAPACGLTLHRVYYH